MSCALVESLLFIKMPLAVAFLLRFFPLIPYGRGIKSCEIRHLTALKILYKYFIISIKYQRVIDSVDNLFNNIYYVLEARDKQEYKLSHYVGEAKRNCWFI